MPPLPCDGAGNARTAWQNLTVDTIARSIVVSSTRTWTVMWPALKAGAHSVVVSATDAAGNTGTQKQRLTVIG